MTRLPWLSLPTEGCDYVWMYLSHSRMVLILKDWREESMPEKSHNLTS